MISEFTLEIYLTCVAELGSNLDIIFSEFTFTFTNFILLHIMSSTLLSCVKISEVLIYYVYSDLWYIHIHISHI